MSRTKNESAQETDMKGQAKESGSRTPGTDAFDELQRDAAFHQLKVKLERGAGQAERGELLDGRRYRFWAFYACSPMSHSTHASGGAPVMERRRSLFHRRTPA